MPGPEAADLRCVLRRRFLPGTPDEIASRLAERYRAGAADGFMLAFSSVPAGVDDFIDQVVPELRRRGPVCSCSTSPRPVSTAG